MSKDESEIDPRTHRPVDAGLSDGHQPIRLDSHTKSLTNRDITSYERIHSKERLLVEHRVSFRQPVMASPPNW